MCLCDHALLLPLFHLEVSWILIIALRNCLNYKNHISYRVYKLLDTKLKHKLETACSIGLNC
jgi:hypothetical protein